jgi:hypothetical protein
MKNQAEIKDISEYYHELYQGVRTEQGIDETYLDDTFKVPWIRDQETVRRLGDARRMIDEPMSQIMTSDVQLSRVEKLITRREDRDRVVELCNDWIETLLGQNPNPFDEHKQCNDVRGEAWIHLVHNDSWMPGGDKSGMPIRFFLEEPMIVFASPNEDERGIPEDVIMEYERMPWIARRIYPEWGRNLSVSDMKKMVKFRAYISKTQDYAEIDGEVVKDQNNMLGVVPFVHALSGFGRNSPTGKMEKLIVGRLRYSRHNIERHCASVTDIDTCIHSFADRSVDVNATDPFWKGREAALADTMREGYKMENGAIHINPFGTTVTRAVEALPEAPVFQYLNSIQADLALETPVVFSSVAVGVGGRQQDMVRADSLKRYKPIITAAERAWSTAFSLTLQILDTVPAFYPDKLKEGDIGGDYNCKIELKNEDPAEAERLSLRGNRMYAEKVIPLEENHTKYQGYTQSKSKQLITDMIVDEATIGNPLFRQVVGRAAIKQLGMEDEMAEVENAQGGMTASGMTPTETQRAQGEVQSPQGLEMAFPRQQRNSPEAFTHEG